jgi:hypothetical protein
MLVKHVMRQILPVDVDLFGFQPTLDAAYQKYWILVVLTTSAASGKV